MRNQQVGDLAVYGFEDIWASAPDDVYVAGLNAILHSTGDRVWVNQFPTEIGTDRVTNIFGFDRSTLYATTQAGYVLRSGGDGRWVADRIEVPSSYPKCIWGTAPDNMYVCGGRGVLRGLPE
jgi:photosystem II stability/assembly factor-like uncharacterized protein